MPLKTEHIAKAFELIEKTELNNTFKETAKGASIFGVSVFVSSVCLGPVGILCGGIIGTVAASAACHKFDSVSYVIRNKLSDDQKEEILKEIKKGTEDVCIEDAQTLFLYLMRNRHLIRIVLNLLRLYGINVSPTYTNILF